MIQNTNNLSSTLKPETLIKKNKTDEKVLKQRAADKAARKAVCIIKHD